MTYDFFPKDELQAEMISVQGDMNDMQVICSINTILKYPLNGYSIQKVKNPILFMQTSFI